MARVCCPVTAQLLVANTRLIEGPPSYASAVLKPLNNGGDDLGYGCFQLHRTAAFHKVQFEYWSFPIQGHVSLNKK
jgi:hypothetical protein